MKKFFVLAGFAVVCMLLSGCNDDPKKVVSDFAEAVKNKDYEKAAAYVEDGTPEDCQKFIKKNPDAQKTYASMKPISAEINGNEAIVKTQVQINVNVKVKKINGQWKMNAVGFRP